MFFDVLLIALIVSLGMLTLLSGLLRYAADSNARGLARVGPNMLSIRAAKRAARHRRFMNWSLGIMLVLILIFLLKQLPS